MTEHRGMTDDQVRRISAALWPTATEPGTRTEEFDHRPVVIVGSDPRRGTLSCTCGNGTVPDLGPVHVSPHPSGSSHHLTPWRQRYGAHLEQTGRYAVLVALGKAPLKHRAVVIHSEEETPCVK